MEDLKLAAKPSLIMDNRCEDQNRGALKRSKLSSPKEHFLSRHGDDGHRELDLFEK